MFLQWFLQLQEFVYDMWLKRWQWFDMLRSLKQNKKKTHLASKKPTSTAQSVVMWLSCCLYSMCHQNTEMCSKCPASLLCSSFILPHRLYKMSKTNEWKNMPFIQSGSREAVRPNNGNLCNRTRWLHVDEWKFVLKKKKNKNNIPIIKRTLPGFISSECHIIAERMFWAHTFLVLGWTKSCPSSTSESSHSNISRLKQNTYIHLNVIFSQKQNVTKANWRKNTALGTFT